MPEERSEMRGRLAETLERPRRHHPALEETLFQRFGERGQSPLEKLGALVRHVIDELRSTQRRLAEQAEDVAALRQTVALLCARIDDLATRVPPSERVAEGHLVLLALAAGYRLVERPGPPPRGDELVEVDGRGFRALGSGRSPLPDDRRPCVLALPLQ